MTADEVAVAFSRMDYGVGMAAYFCYLFSVSTRPNWNSQQTASCFATANVTAYTSSSLETRFFAEQYTKNSTEFTL